jgi:hypothetical protein
MTMVERNMNSFKLVSKKPLLFFFTMASMIFLMSWFFVLRSTSRPNFIYHNLLPNSKLFSTPEDSKFHTKIPNVDSSFGNRAILVDNEDVEDESETNNSNDGGKCSNRNDVFLLKVFMYDLPSEFHFGLLDWKPSGNSVWPNVRTSIPGYPGGLNLQHSIEFWLTLDILASEIPNAPKANTVIRVRNSSEADIIFVPFFSSLSYNRNSKPTPHEKKTRNMILQEKLVKYLTSQEEWKRSKGKDHLIIAHHPNSMLDARMKLWPATFILSDFGRYPSSIANVEKDVIAPYKHLIPSYVNDNSTFDSRTTLLYFQGAIYRKDVCISLFNIFVLFFVLLLFL